MKVKRSFYWILKNQRIRLLNILNDDLLTSELTSNQYETLAKNNTSYEETAN